MNILRNAFLAALITSFCVTAGMAQEREIDSLMQRAHRIRVFNGNVLVVKEGKTLYHRSFGYARGDKSVRLDTSFVFNIGSIGKEFNGVGIMMLKERGLLKLEDPVAQYLPALPAWAKKISILNLLQYTSGLPDIQWQTIKNDADIMNDMMKITQLNFEPGTAYAYNNSNVFLQRRIIEKVSGMSFHDFVRVNMLVPGGMKNTLVDPDLSLPGMAVSFNNDGVESPRQRSYVMSGWTAPTTRDLYRWNVSLHGYKLISKASVLQILQPWAPNRQSSLGGGEIKDGEILTHYHHGSSSDFEALMHTDLKKDITVILMTNNMNFKVFDIRDAILNILEGKTYKVPRKSLLMVLKKSLDTESLDETLEKYNVLKASAADEVSFEESELNGTGYYLMGKKRYGDAVRVMALNLELFPESANAHDSLAEAWYNAGDHEKALFYYRKALQMDPSNTGAAGAVADLEKELQKK